MIIVAGSINLDLIARVPRLPTPGETLTGLDFTTAPGGKGANQALAAKRAGGAVAMIGATGTDANAKSALALLHEASIDLTAVKTCAPGVPTGVALILVDDATGENEIVVVPGANAQVDEKAATEYERLGQGTALLQMEIPAKANHAILDMANTSGALSLLNIAPYGDDAVGLSAKASITIANETEFDLLSAAMSLSGTGRVEQAQQFVARTGKTIIVTLGPEGAFAASLSGVTRSKAPLVEPVDTVGAGDTFCGYLAAALAAGDDLAQAMNLACRAGALACMKRGAQPAIPTRLQVDQFKA